MVCGFKLTVIDNIISKPDGRHTDECEITSFDERPAICMWRQNGAKKDHQYHEQESDKEAFEFCTPRSYITEASSLQEADEDPNGQAHVVSNAE